MPVPSFSGAPLPVPMAPSLVLPMGWLGSDRVFAAALSPQLLASLSTGCLFHQHQGWNPTGPIQTGSPMGPLWENMNL